MGCSQETLAELIAAFNCTTPQFGAEVNTRTSTPYALVLEDANDIIETNLAGASVINIPLNSNVAFPIGTTVSVVQYGAGATTVQGVAGVTVNGVAGGSVLTPGQYQSVTIYKRGTNEWVALT